jgi:universal stress protein F
MNRILVCLDSSPRAPHVLAAAVDLAQRTNSRLTLFRSVGLPPEIDQESLIGVKPAAVIDRLVGAAQQDLLRFRDDVPSDLLDVVEVKVGTPWTAICAEAEATKADLIVIGSHGYAGFDRILGTTAAKVVNHAKCSVFVVR